MKISNFDQKLAPEGFRELYEVLSKLGDVEVEAREIQERLQDEPYEFTEGKITGTIRRAKEKNMILQIGRGKYKLSDEFQENSSSFSLKKSINKEVEKLEETISERIDETINEIKKNFADNVDTATNKDLEKAQNVIKELEKVKQHNKNAIGDLTI